MRTNLIADCFFVEKNCLFLDCFLGNAYIDVLIIKNVIKTNQIDMGACFFKVDNIFLFPSVYWFLNLTLTNKHGPINL